MSADLLRRAAAKMRENAKAATPGPWDAETSTNVGRVFRQDVLLAKCSTAEQTDPANAVHIASWHPDVALAVADWLDLSASDIWAWGPVCECGSGCDACDDSEWEPHARAALTVARTYLGEDA